MSLKISGPRLRTRDSQGITLVEVMMAMAIIGIAILPTLGLFDTGVKGTRKQVDYMLAMEIAEQEMNKYLTCSWEDLESFSPTMPSPNFEEVIAFGPVTYNLSLEVLEPSASVLLSYIDENGPHGGMFDRINEDLDVRDSIKRLVLAVKWNDVVGKQRTYELSTIRVRLESK